MAIGLFILGMLLWGLAIGWVGMLLLGGGRSRQGIDWTQALIAGVLGSLLGGTVGSLLLGEGFQLRPGGIVASIAGAVIVLLIWNAITARRTQATGGSARHGHA